MVDKSHLKSNTAHLSFQHEGTVITMPYYFWPHSICTADLLLVKLYHHPRLSCFVRSQWVGLSRIAVALINGNKSTFLWEGKKDERDRPMWWGGILSDCSWWQIRCAPWYEAICSLRCLDAVCYNFTLNRVSWRCKKQLRRTELYFHTALDILYGLEQFVWAFSTLASREA